MAILFGFLLFQTFILVFALPIVTYLIIIAENRYLFEYDDFPVRRIKECLAFLWLSVISIVMFTFTIYIIIIEILSLPIIIVASLYRFYREYAWHVQAYH